MKKKLLYSGPEYALHTVEQVLGDSFDIIRAEPEPEQLLPLFEQCDVYLDASMKVRIDETAIAGASRLALVATATTGADHIDQAALAVKGIPLYTLKGQKETLAGITASAEHSWALLMACARKIVPAAAHVHAGGWDRSIFAGTMLSSKTLGVIGFGRNGSWMARYANAFGMKVVAWNRSDKEMPDYVEKVELEQLMAVADYITVHLSLVDETKNFIDSRLIAIMKPGATFINTSRGEIADEAALADALRSGQISAVGVDVLGGEPEIEKNPLWRLAQSDPRVVITPHVGGNCPQALEHVLKFTCGRIKDYFEGEAK